MLRLQLIGRMMAARDQVQIPLPTHRDSRRLIALLALDGGRWRERKDVASSLWGEEDTSQALSLLRRHIFAVRRWLSSHQCEGSLEVERARVRLHEGAALSVDYWGVLGAKPDAPLAAAQRASIIAAMDAPLLDGWQEPWVESARALLKHRVDEVVPRLLDELVGRADWEGAYELALRWQQLDPLVESRYRVLMWLANRLGDADGSTEWFARCARSLDEHFGVEVDTATRALHASLTSGVLPAWDTVLRGGSKRREGQDPAASGMLPAWTGELVGRDEDLEAVRLRLARHRRVTLVGTGGVGKTAMALRVAHRVAPRYLHGAYWLDLVPLVEPDLLAQHIAEQMGVEVAAEQEALEALQNFLHGRRLLLVLDNCEHVIEATAELVDQLSAQVDGLDVLATSRRPLGYVGEGIWPLEPLSVTDVAGGTEGPAVELLLLRVRQARGKVSITAAEQRHAAPIAARLAGIPLALELAAARAAVLGLDEVAGGLGRYFDLLAGQRRDLDDRQRTMWAAIDWSWQLLDSEQRTLLALLSVFRGGCDREAARALAMVHRASDVDVASALGLEDRGSRDFDRLVANRLDMLVEQSLLVSSKADSVQRYHLHEPIRQFAEQRLDAVGGLPAARSTHAELYTYRAGLASQGLGGEERHVWLARLEEDRDNLRAAMSFLRSEGQVDRQVRLGGNLFRYWYSKGYFGWEYDWLCQAVDAARALPPNADLAAACYTAAAMSYAKGRCPLAVDYASRAMDLYGQVSDEHGAVRGQVLRAMSRVYAGDLGGACKDAEAALVRAGQDDELRIQALDALAFIDRKAGRYDRARACMEDALALHRDADSPPNRIYGTLANLGWIAWQQGFLLEADDWFREARAIAEQVESRPMLCEAIAGQAEVNLCVGEAVAGEALAREGLILAQDLEDRFAQANALTLMAMSALARGEYPTARLYARRGVEAYRALAGSTNLVTALYYRAEIALSMSDVDAARAIGDELGQLAPGRTDPRGIGLAHRGVALCAWACDDPLLEVAKGLWDGAWPHLEAGERFESVRALAWLAAALHALGRFEDALCVSVAARALRETIGATPWPVDREREESIDLAAGQQLDAAVAASARERGRSLAEDADRMRAWVLSTLDLVDEGVVDRERGGDPRTR